MTAQAMQEIDVLRQVRSFLLRGGLDGERVVDLYTDAHPTLRADPSLRPFQRFALLLDGLTVHPDLVGRLSDGATTFAVEAKGTSDLLRGLGQAACYRLGFHHVLLASAGLPPPALRLLAREQHIGLLAAYPDQVQLLELPPAHLPLQRHAAAIEQQFLTTSALQTTFSFNSPTHYLSVACALRDGQTLPLAALHARLRASYAVLPQGAAAFRAVLRGAQKLGLVVVRDGLAAPTLVGTAAGQLLPDLPTLSAIHHLLTRRGAQTTLSRAHPAAGAVLRWLLAADPLVTLILDMLSTAEGALAMPELARRALERDRVRALALFFNPETISEITDLRGHIVWTQVAPRHYRSSTFYQYKSILKHAGLLAPHRLGGASVAAYDPAADVWERMPSDASDAGEGG